MDGYTVHTFSSKEPGQIYNRRESFRVPIGESLLMYRIVTKTTEEGETEETLIPFEALLSDLSVNGAGIFTNENMDVGTEISFDMPTSLGIMTCRGEVVRKTDVYDKPFSNFYGCEFSVTRKNWNVTCLNVSV